jgi:hypothetical protein
MTTINFFVFCFLFFIITLKVVANARLVGCDTLVRAGMGATRSNYTIEWAEPVDGHWWDPLRWRDSTTGEPRVPTGDDQVFIATRNSTTYSVFVDVPQPPTSHSLPLGNDCLIALAGVCHVWCWQALQTGQTVIVKSLTVGSLESSCCENSGAALCWAAIVLRGGAQPHKLRALSGSRIAT